MIKRECTLEESDYYAELDEMDESILKEKEKYGSQFDGSYEAKNGDWEGACLARAEYEAGYIS